MTERLKERKRLNEREKELKERERARNRMTQRKRERERERARHSCVSFDIRYFCFFIKTFHPSNVFIDSILVEI